MSKSSAQVETYVMWLLLLKYSLSVAFGLKMLDTLNLNALWRHKTF